jgi:hypothetical protein
MQSRQAGGEVYPEGKPSPVVSLISIVLKLKTPAGLEDIC